MKMVGWNIKLKQYGGLIMQTGKIKGSARIQLSEVEFIKMDDRLS